MIVVTMVVVGVWYVTMVTKHTDLYMIDVRITDNSMWVTPSRHSYL